MRIAFKKVAPYNLLSPINSKIYKWFFVSEVMEQVSKKLLDDVRGTVIEEKHSSNPIALSNLRKKLLEIEVNNSEVKYTKLEKKNKEINELYALRGILTPNQINEYFSCVGGPKSMSCAYEIAQAIKYNTKPIALTEDFWIGINPYFWDQ
jgi:hypothetical protein